MKPIYSFLILISACLVLAVWAYADPLSEAGPKSANGAKSEVNDLRLKPNSYWRKKLSKKQFEVCREGGTERAFSGEYNDYKKEGVYHCSSCGHSLFSSEAKFDSGTGWPSFYRPLTEEAVELKRDFSWGMFRTEVVCSNCGAHLGHVFDDGPAPTGKRYCINSVCLSHHVDDAK